jgi:transporter family-2 protein
MLGRTLHQPIFAALVVAATNVAVYLVAAIFLGLSWPDAGRIGQVPWWAWIGGALGAVYVLAMIFAADILGAAVFTGLTVTAATIISVVLDHFGWVGFQQHAASIWRIAGCVLMISGLALIWKF